ncbi:MAG TPA: hypothetical protein VN843_31485, partial [Anaerolineales bacterium]|nr:hypothetical protein [Anaerolineales bacterium]
MAQYVKQGDIFGRIGTGVGKGLAEQVPKEIERNRLASGLQALGEQTSQDPIQAFSQLVSIPGMAQNPQLMQTFGDLLRQRSVLNSINQRDQGIKGDINNPPPGSGKFQPIEGPVSSPKTATTTGSTQARLEPYVPPTGPERRQMAAERMAEQPLIYPNMESALSSVEQDVAANTQRSNAEIQKGELERNVQTGIENKLNTEMAALQTNELISPTMSQRLKQEAVQDVVDGKMSEAEAANFYSKKANEIARDFAKVNGWGGIGLIQQGVKDLQNSIKSIRDRYFNREDRRDFA